MTPPEWLHMTTLVAGSAEEISRDQMSQMLSVAQEALARMSPIPVTLSKILYHPEAVMLAARPVSALTPVLAAAQEATLKVTGHAGVVNESQTWTPHVTVSYSTAAQAAGPIIAALGNAIPEHTVLIDSLTLVIQWGAERLWNWEAVGTVALGS